MKATRVISRGRWSAIAASISVAAGMSTAACAAQTPGTDTAADTLGDSDAGPSVVVPEKKSSNSGSTTSTGASSSVYGGNGSATSASTSSGTAMNTTGAVVATGTSSTNKATGGASGSSSSTATGASNGFPSGWLYTSGNKIYQSNGTSGTPWMGRGVNMDDIYFCGYNDSMWMTNPEQTLESIVTGLMAWKPTFVRVSLAMNSHSVVSSWTSNPAQYSTPMTNVIRALGANPGVYVLVTVRSDSTMVESDPPHEETYIPTQATDATYTALVDTFANDKFVVIGLDNEPGTISGSDLTPLMSHAVGVIRAEEDRLGVPHHLVSVPGDHWASDISFYSASPLPYDNVVYEIHGYPPPAVSYTFSNIPVIIGEYGDLPDGSFYADMEAKQIPNLAWDFEPFVDCSPDLLNPIGAASPLTASSWGSTVYNYLTSH